MIVVVVVVVVVMTMAMMISMMGLLLRLFEGRQCAVVSFKSHLFFLHVGPGVSQENHNTPWPVEKSMAAEARLVADALFYRINRAAGPCPLDMCIDMSIRCS